MSPSSSHRLSPDRGFRSAALALALLAAMSAESFAGPPPRAYLPDEPKLFKSGTAFRLKVNASKTVPVMRSWLVPDDLDEAGRYVSSVNYSETVHAFAIGGTRYAGLHLSSFEAMQSGSAMAAAGRDVFLIIDTFDGRLFPALTGLGETKGRVRSAGCFFATHHTFYKADVNGDGYGDIGVQREQLRCQAGKSKDGDVLGAPAYELGPVRWHIYRDRAWHHEPAHDGTTPRDAYKFPLIDLERSPVDFVLSVIGRK